jgi:hypothetical protein
MTNQEDALAYLRANNPDGAVDNVIADIEAGRLKAGILRLGKESQSAIEHLRAGNVLGRFDPVLRVVDQLVAEPVVYVSAVR